MKRFLTIMTAGILALLSFNSCDILGDFNAAYGEANLSCTYDGGLPSTSANQTYDLNGRLSDKKVEEIFYDLCSMVQPGFRSAVLKIDLYDKTDSYRSTSVYDFKWEADSSGDGDYTWTERMD